MATLQHLPDEYGKDRVLEHLLDAQEASGIGSWDLDVVTHRLWLSPELCRIMDLDYGTVDTLEAFAMSRPPERREIFRQAIAEAIRTATPMCYDAPVLRRDGEVRWVRSTGKVYCDEAGRAIRILGAVEDFTELRLAGEALERKTRQIEEANAALTAQAAMLLAQGNELQRLSHLKDEFLSMLSHELRTPLTTIQGTLSLLARHDARRPDPEIEACHRRIGLALRSLTSLVADSLSAAQLRSDRFELRRRNYQPADLLNEAVDEVAPLAEANGLAVTVYLQTPMPAMLGDYGRLIQVLRNLLLNAIRHTPPDAEITVSATTDGERLLIAVADTGNGLTAEAKAHLFEPFSPTSSDEGIGLGLFVVKELVEAHGGAVSVESEPGHGTTFTLALPIG